MKRRGHYPWACSVLALASAAEAGETVTYTYDALGRLTATTSSGSVNNGVATAIAYDPAGNRSTYTVSGVNSPSVAGGGFEIPEVGASYLYRPTGGFANNSGIAGNGSAWGFAAAPEGDQVAFLQTIAAPAVISLAVSGLTAGTSYTTAFHLAVRPGYPANPVTVAFDGAALGTFTPGSTSFTAVTSPAFTAAASSGTLTFTGASYSGDASTGLDNVTVAAAAGTPPPPPPPPPPGNQPPTAAPDSVSVMACIPTYIPVLDNDTDPEGNIPLVLIGVTQGTKGTASVSNGKRIYYTPGSQTGTDVLSYTVRDSLGASSTGTLTITITVGQC